MSPKVLQTPSRHNKQIQEYVNAVQDGMNIQFVVKSDRGWSVQRANAKKATGVFSTKQEAVSKAKDIAKNQRTGVYVFGVDGLISEQYAY